VGIVVANIPGVFGLPGHLHDVVLIHGVDRPCPAFLQCRRRWRLLAGNVPVIEAGKVIMLGVEISELLHRLAGGLIVALQLGTL